MLNTVNPQKKIVKPRPLLKGGRIGIVAPAGRVNVDMLQKGVTWLEQRGFKTILGKHLEKECRYFAGKDPERAEDFEQMFQNKEVDAVICARGGVGAARIIPFLNRNLLVGSPKIFVGSSDITTLLLYMNELLGWVTFHGPMVATLFSQSPSTRLESELFQQLAGEVSEMQFEGLTVLRNGMAQGLLTGGCLTLICTTIGTPYEIDTKNKILFIEDINEAAFRIDRMLSYLKYLGKFDQVKGVVFGEMVQCQAETLPEIILDILGDFSIPIFFGFPSGHGEGTATLPLGLPVEMDSNSISIKMLEPAVQ